MLRPSAARAAAALALLLAVGGVPAQAVEPTPTPGAAGAGDPYFPRDGNGGYDVAHYDIHDTYRLGTKHLWGWTDVSATATQDLSSFHLDLVLPATSVTVDGRPAASYSQTDGHELVVTPDTPVLSGSHFTVRVHYNGYPAKDGYGGEHPFFGTRHEAMATNEPHVAPWWFAADDHPSDKASFDVTMRVPRGQQVFSNGTLRHRTFGHTWTTWSWHLSQPVSTYLAYFAAGRFRWEKDVVDGRPSWFAVSRGLSRSTQDRAMQALRRTSAIVAWESRQFGDYPFSSTGGVVTALNTGFALENASRPTYPWWGSYAGAVGVEVHELAHQWFGDDVSVQRWRDIWLNEGFASWVEWFYGETHNGPTAQRRLMDDYRSLPASDPLWRIPVADPGPDRIFDEAVYERGAMTLQALRHRIGRSAFSTLLRTWVQRHAYGNATVEDFQQLAAEVSGQDLSGFFDAWLHTGSRPERTAANGLS